MDQLELFNIEPIQKRPFERKNDSLRIKPKRKRLKYPSELMEQLSPEVKKRAIIVCKQPKTIKYIPYNATKEEEARYIAMHYDENGKFRIDPPGDFNVFGGQVNRG